jgi:hypothetical protein
VRVRSPESISARTRERAGDPSRLGDRVDHQPGQRALPQLAREQPFDEVGLFDGRPAEELAENLLAPCRRSAARRPLHLGYRAIEIVDGERRLAGGRSLDAVDRRIADADSALPGDSREETNRDRHLIRVEPPQESGQDRDLFRA